MKILKLLNFSINRLRLGSWFGFPGFRASIRLEGFKEVEKMAMVFAPRLAEADATSHAGPSWSPYDNNGG